MATGKWQVQSDEVSSKKDRGKEYRNRGRKDSIKTLCIEFNGWLFEGYEDTKTSLCGVILDALADEKRFSKEITDYAKTLIKKIDFNKILGKSIKYGLDFFLTGGIGALTDLTLSSVLSTIKTNVSEVQAKDLEEILNKFKKDDKTRTEIKNFREEFKQLLQKVMQKMSLYLLTNLTAVCPIRFSKCLRPCDYSFLQKVCLLLQEQMNALYSIQ